MKVTMLKRFTVPPRNSAKFLAFFLNEKIKVHDTSGNIITGKLTAVQHSEINPIAVIESPGLRIEQPINLIEELTGGLDK